MIASRARSATGADVDPVLDKVVEELTNKLHAGLPVDVEFYIHQYPEHARAIRDIYSALEVMADLGRSAIQPAGGHAHVPHELAGGPGLNTLGDYRIIREVGRGGMGVVYEATQLSLGRRVALKVLPLAAALDPRQRQRFQVEAQAAAQLHHTHIVPVFAVGCERGVHYYAMQLIDGQSLAAVIRDMQWLAQSPAGEDGGPPRSDSDKAARESSQLAQQLLSGEWEHGPNGPTAAEPATLNEPGAAVLGGHVTGGLSGSRLTERPVSSGLSNRNRAFFRTVARLGVQAAEALDHAHALGVLHRDIKPANLIVDSRGELWVTDFGLARLQNEAGLTLSGDLLGTLRYMSPEQALAKRVVVDHRTDIYSLGITIYELITLRPAFEGKDRQELLRQIAELDPVAPRRINPAIPRDLETIVLKAMAKEPVARYASAQELAADLQAFLDDRPISARRPTPLEHLAKWSRRHQAVVVTALVGLVLAMAAGMATQQWHHRKTDAALRSEQAALRKTANALKAEHDARQREREALNNMLPASSALFTQASSLAFRSMEVMATHRPGTPEAQEFFRKALAFFEGWARITHDRADVRTQEAEANYRVGFTRMILGIPTADEAYQRAIRLFDQELAEHGHNPGAELMLAEALYYRSFWLMYQSRFDEAISEVQRSLDVTRSLIRKHPDDPQYLANIAGHQVGLAEVFDKAGKPAEALQACRDLGQYLAQLEADTSRRQVRRQVLAQGFLTLANEQSKLGRPREAIEAIAHSAELNPRDAQLSMTLNNLAWSLVSDPARPIYDPRQGAKLAQQAIDANPDQVPAWNTLGVAQYRCGNWSAAIRALEESIKRTGHVGPHDSLFMAMALWQQGQHSQAREWQARATAAIANDPKLAEDAELKQFTAEAAALLGKTSTPEPAQEKAGIQ